MDGTIGNDNLMGTNYEDYIYGDLGNDTIKGLAGNDYLDGDEGDDTINGGVGNDYLSGDDGNDSIVGSSGFDSLNGGAGIDTADFSSGSSRLSIWLYDPDSWDPQAGFTYNRDDGVREDTLTSIENAIGTAYNDSFLLSIEPNVIDGGAGFDYAIYYYIGEFASSLTGARPSFKMTWQADGSIRVQNRIKGLESDVDVLTNIEGVSDSLGNDSITGNGSDNYVYLEGGSDTVDGGAGIDEIEYYGSVEVNLEAGWADKGRDGTRDDSISGIENVWGSDGSDVIRGNSGANRFDGEGGDDTLIGAGGADVLRGGAGNDTYSVDNLGDNVQESTVLNGSTDAGGTDTVQSAVSFTLGSFLETLILTGAGAINGTGNGLNNVITGNAGANTLGGGAGGDTLNGGAGADVLQGGAGNDVYVVDNVMDKAQESTVLNGSTDAGGADTVNSSVSFMLGSFVENLTLTGAAGINGTGNGLNNRITGNAGINTLNGGAGADTLLGGAGNDTYIVDNSADIINESITLTTEIDSVRSSVARTLGANFEVLILTGTAAIDATGNVLNNVLTGNAAANRLDGAAGNDTLDGGAGVDTLVGGVGDDRYIRSAGDVLQESANAGTDLVLTDSSCTLDPNLEQLALTGSSSIYGNGNELANTLTGNVGNNLLQGAAGNDTLNGGAGADTLRGGTGDDRYIRSAGDVLEESASAGTDLVISDSSFTLDPNFEQLALTGSSNLYGNGNQLANTLVGNSGNNLLQGSAGNDTLNGGIGLDTLVGGTGVDTFAFGTALDAATNVDTIRDWDAGGTQDRIALDDDVFLALGSVTTATALDPTMFVAGAAALDANDHIIYDQTTGAMYYDVDGAGGVGQVQFAILGTTSHPALGAGDFVVVG